MLLSIRLRGAYFPLLAVGLLALTLAPVQAGTRAAATPASISSQDKTTAVALGGELERSKKWLEAIEHYEKAAKAWPETPELDYGLRRSKIHFAIERRYADSSFLGNLLPMSRTEALALFDEVWQKIQAHYVDIDHVNSTSFVAHGTESLYLALDDEQFLERNVPQRLRAKVAAFRRLLRQEYWNRPVASREPARSLVQHVCDLARTELELAPTPVVMEYIFGGCNSLDDYSGYLTPSRLNDLYGNIEGQFVGLGIEMKSEKGKGLLLVNVLPDSPAAEGGLLSGEHIVGIDGVDCRDMATDGAASRLQGLEGSQVTLDVQRDDATPLRKVRLFRRAVNVKSLPIVRMVDRENGIGYIQMTSFQKSSATEMDAALRQLRQEGMRSLVWDLRGNPGGLLTAAVEVLDRFIAEGVLVSTRGRTGDQNFSYTARRPGTWNQPLILLVDGDSASASEIVAGAVRDHRRGRIVGRKSYGKWSVQSIFPVSSNTGLRLTTAKFYSPHGHTLGKIGVNPDVEVAEPAKHRTYFRAPTDVDLEGDADVQKAVELLRQQLVAR